MRIVKAPVQVKEFETSCQDCDTVVALEARDCTYMSDQRDGNAVKWKCPTCKRENWVAVSVVPPSFVRAVKGVERPL